MFSFKNFIILSLIIHGFVIFSYSSVRPVKQFQKAQAQSIKVSFKQMPVEPEQQEVEIPKEQPKEIIKKPQPKKLIKKTVPKKKEIVKEAVQEVKKQQQSSVEIQQVSAEEKLNYEQILANWIARHKIYPARAQRRKMTGEVMLYVKINQSGQILNYQIREQSGHQILNDSAVKMLQKAEPLPEIPAEFRLRTYDFVVPIVFKLG